VLSKFDKEDDMSYKVSKISVFLSMRTLVVLYNRLCIE